MAEATAAAPSPKSVLPLHRSNNAAFVTAGGTSAPMSPSGTSKPVSPVMRSRSLKNAPAEETDPATVCSLIGGLEPTRHGQDDDERRKDWFQQQLEMAKKAQGKSNIKSDLAGPDQTIVEALQETMESIMSQLKEHYANEELGEEGEGDRVDCGEWDPEAIMDSLMQYLDNLSDNNQESTYAGALAELGNLEVTHQGMENQLQKLERDQAETCYLEADTYEVNMASNVAQTEMKTVQNLGKLGKIADDMEQLHRRIYTKLEKLKNAARKDRGAALDWPQKDRLKALREESYQLANKVLALNVDTPEVCLQKAVIIEKLTELQESTEKATTGGARIKIEEAAMLYRLTIVEEACAIVEHSNFALKGCGIHSATSEGALEVIEELKGRLRRSAVLPAMSGSDQLDETEQLLKSIIEQNVHDTNELLARRGSLQSEIGVLNEQMSAAKEPRPYKKLARDEMRLVCCPSLQEHVRIGEPPNVSSDNGADLFFLVSNEFDNMYDASRKLRVQLNTYQDLVSAAKSTLSALSVQRGLFVEHIQKMKSLFVEEALAKQLDIPKDCAWLMPKDSYLRASLPERRRILTNIWNEQEHQLLEGSDALSGRQSFADELLTLLETDVAKTLAALYAITKFRDEERISGVTAPQEVLEMLGARDQKRLLPFHRASTAADRRQSAKRAAEEVEDVPPEYGLEYVKGNPNKIVHKSCVHEGEFFKESLERHLNIGFSKALVLAMASTGQAANRRRRHSALKFQAVVKKTRAQLMNEMKEERIRSPASSQASSLWTSKASPASSQADDGELADTAQHNLDAMKLWNELAVDSPLLSEDEGAADKQADEHAAKHADVVRGLDMREIKQHGTSESGSSRGSPLGSPKANSESRQGKSGGRVETRQLADGAIRSAASLLSIGHRGSAGLASQDEANDASPQRVAKPKEKSSPKAKNPEFGRKLPDQGTRIRRPGLFLEPANLPVFEVAPDALKDDDEEDDNYETETDRQDNKSLERFRVIHAKNKVLVEKTTKSFERTKQLRSAAGGLPLDPGKSRSVLSGPHAQEIKNTMQDMVKDHVEWWQSRKGFNLEARVSSLESRQDVVFRETYARLKLQAHMTSESSDQEKAGQPGVEGGENLSFLREATCENDSDSDESGRLSSSEDETADEPQN